MIRQGVSIALLLSVVACGSMPEKVQISGCLFPGSNDMAPSWICDASLDGLIISEVGSTVKLAEGPGVMRRAATLNGRERLVATISSQLKGVLQLSSENFATPDDFNVIFDDLITRESLTAARVYISQNAPDGSLYVLVGLEEATLQAVLVEAITRSMSQTPGFWESVRNDKPQEVLRDEIVQQFMESVK